jgi:hypothetical protein
MAETIESNDPILLLKGLGKELWAYLGGGDAVIAWPRCGTAMPPPWKPQDAVSECNRKGTATLLPDYLL